MKGFAEYRVLNTWEILYGVLLQSRTIVEEQGRQGSSALLKHISSFDAAVDEDGKLTACQVSKHQVF